MNRIVLIGRLTKDPEKRVTQSGKETASFTLAVDRSFKDKNGEKQTDFIPVVCWGTLANLAEKYLGKGSLAAVTGRIQVRNYEDKNRVKRTATEVVADEVQFLEKKAKYPDNEDPFGDISELDESELPF